jgi:hypothetical protein
MTVTKKTSWTRGDVRKMLRESNLAVQRAVIRLYAEQVDYEKQIKQSFYKNFRGFCKQDGGHFSRVAEQVLKGEPMTREQVEFARPRMMKYARQLARWANHDFQALQNPKLEEVQ